MNTRISSKTVRSYFLNTFVWLMVAGVSLSAQSAETVLFEGYSKIISTTAHIGYTIARYSYDTSKKQFKSITFMKIKSGDTEATESLTAVAADNFAPISFSYNFVQGKDGKSVTGDFKGDVMTIVVQEKGETKKTETNLKKGTFLSTFLVYMMLKSKMGIQTGAKYSFFAIAEEDGKVFPGEAKVGAIEKVGKFNLFKIENKFKDVSFSSLVSEKGEMFLVDSISQGMKIELVTKPNDATADFGLSVPILKALFGEVPLGTQNALSQSIKPVEFQAQPQPDAGPIDKGSNIKAGSGILLKKGQSPVPPKKPKKLKSQDENLQKEKN